MHVPLGLIEADWGGTAAECWTSESALKTMHDFDAQLADLEAALLQKDVTKPCLKDLSY